MRILEHWIYIEIQLNVKELNMKPSPCCIYRDTSVSLSQPCYKANYCTGTTTTIGYYYYYYYCYIGYYYYY